MITASEQGKLNNFDRPAPDDVVRFLEALFDRYDHILVRPTETWTEGQRRFLIPNNDAWRADVGAGV